MQKIRDEIDELLLETYKIENLVKLLEDYFYGQNNQEDFWKNQTVADIVLEKIKFLDEKLNHLYEQVVK